MTCALPLLLVHASVFGGGLTQSIAPAQRVDMEVRAASGTGLSLAGGADTGALAGRSPAFVNLELGLRLDRIAWLEFSGGVFMELEGRVTVGVLPRLRAHLPRRGPVSAYAIAGLPLLAHPYTLLGAQGGLGISFAVAPRLRLVAETTGTAYFAGTDLIRGSALAKFDLALGVNLTF